MKEIKSIKYTIEDFEGNSLLYDKYIELITGIEDLKATRDIHFGALNVLDSYIKDLEKQKKSLESLVQIIFEEPKVKEPIKNECNINIINTTDARNL